MSLAADDLRDGYAICPGLVDAATLARAYLRPESTAR
jgi:hypothetical protein